MNLNPSSDKTSHVTMGNDVTCPRQFPQMLNGGYNSLTGLL